MSSWEPVPITLDDSDEIQLAESRSNWSVPVPEPRAQAWIREGLLLAAASGTVHLAQPHRAPRNLLRWKPDPVAMAATDDVLGLACSGRLSMWTLHDQQVLWAFKCSLIRNIHLQWCGSLLVAVGVDNHDHTLLIIHDESGEQVMEMELPAGTVVGVEDTGDIYLARSVSAGLQKLVLFEPEMLKMVLGMDAPSLKASLDSLSTAPPTRHQLRPAPGGRLVGLTTAGVSIWAGHRTSPRIYSCSGCNAAAIHPAGRSLAMGTEQGIVYSVPMDQVNRLNERVGWLPGAVRDVAFSADGRYLSALGGVCRIWQLS